MQQTTLPQNAENQPITHFGSFDQGAAADVLSNCGIGNYITTLTGAADVIPPHGAGNYVVETAGVDAMTLAAPTAEVDDGILIAIFSDTTNAHTVTATSLFANGTALKTTATFAAFKGAGMVLRAYDGVWQVISSTGVTFT